MPPFTVFPALLLLHHPRFPKDDAKTLSMVKRNSSRSNGFSKASSPRCLIASSPPFKETSTRQSSHAPSQHGHGLMRRLPDQSSLYINYFGKKIYGGPRARSSACNN